MSNGQTAPADGAPTPPQEATPSGAYASYVPHDLKYDLTFEDAIMRLVTHPPTSPSNGIRVLPADSTESPIEGISIPSGSISLRSLPLIPENDLPLPLSDPRRIFASPIPGIKLTHPVGYLEGGRGLDPEMDTFAEDFLQRNTNAKSRAELKEAQDREIEELREELRDRMRARERAAEHNRRIERDLLKMQEEHALERKVQRQLAEKRRAKREAKERA